MDRGCVNCDKFDVVRQIQWERDTAIQQLKELGYGLGEKIRTDGDTISRQEAIDSIMEEPSEVRYPVFYAEKIRQLSSAQPEIIRCRECEHYHPSYCEIWSKYGTVQTREMGYCYMAERRGR